MTIKSELRIEILNNYKKDINDIIPNNDLEAWEMYPEYNFIYNKMFICKFQNIKHYPMPIYPNKYPIVIKPIINLMGMGLNAIKINNDNEFEKHLNNNHFWSEYFEGEHLSWDIILKKGQINFLSSFKGYKNKIFGAFNYWELIKNKKLPIIINELVKTHLSDYTGCLNVETIDNNMIECHLRIGDADQLPKDYLRLIYLNYIDKKMDIKLEISKLKLNHDIYLVPVWQKINENHNLDEIYDYLIDKWENDIINNDDIKMYYFDKPGHAYPSNLKRWFLIVVYEYRKGMKIKKMIEKDLINTFNI